MKQFSGFPSRSVFTPIPAIYFSSLIPEIDDINELRANLYIFQMLYPKKGTPKFITFSELINNPGLTKSLQGFKDKQEQILHEVLKQSIDRGTILGLQMNKDGVTEELFLLNTEDNRKAIENIRDGTLQLSGLTVERTTNPVVEQPDIFTMYEENIGILTPLIADELIDAEKNYPADWLRDAIKEAVSLNKRNWRYVSRVLERWATEGRKDGTHQRHTKENIDPDKFIRGKYGNVVRR
jgi:DNA replication protein